jgi:hypothetical protein
MFLGSDTIRPLLRRLRPTPRFDVATAFLHSHLYRAEEAERGCPGAARSWLSPRADVYAMAELIRRQRGGARRRARRA